MKWTLLLTLFLTFNVTIIYADDVENEISALMEKYDAIGVSVAVVKDEKIVYSKSFGYKNKEDSIPLTNDDLFRIASVSKTFVATAIMQHVEKGRISLDDDVNRYLDFKVQNPKFPDAPITIKMLLCHRSSINDSQGRDNFDRINPEKNPNFAKCYNDYAPGNDYTYSNMNYNILAAVIEKISRERFDRYIDNHIMKPIGLHGSFNGLDLDSTLFVSPYLYSKKNDSLYLVQHIYQPQNKDLNDYKLGYSTTAFQSPGGMIITAEELAKYMMMHMNDGKYHRKRILKARSERRMREVQTERHQYALSFTNYRRLIPNEELIGQTGWAHGIHTAMIFNPEKKYGFVVLDNGYKTKSTDIRELEFVIIRKLFDFFCK